MYFGSGNANSCIEAGGGHVKRRGPAAIAALFGALACIGLAACGVSTAGSERAAAQTGAEIRAEAKARRQHQLVVSTRLVRCVRRSGFDLPKPKASGRIDIRGVDVHSPRYRAALTGCLHKLDESTDSAHSGTSVFNGG